MSSIVVRDLVSDFIVANSPDKLVDLSGRFEDLRDLIEEEGLTPDVPWVGIEFVGNDESPITTPSTNTQGKYRETGAVYIHVVGVAGLGSARSVLVRADALRGKLRGQRLGALVVDSVSPANTDSGTSLNLEGGYFSASFLFSYTYDLDL